MINKTLLSIAFLLCVLVTNGQPKISPHTLSFLHNHSNKQISKSPAGKNNPLYAKTVTEGNTTLIDAFITLHPSASTATVIAEGAQIYTRVGDILTVQIPVDKIVTISELEAVKRVSVARPVRLKNDKSRVSTQVATIHTGTGLEHPYTGKGVIVGCVDTGIDVNHIAFTNEAGVSRVKRVYFPSDNSGTPPSGNGIDGKRYSGSEYTTPTQIAKLTTDTKGESHGSHTTSIAAGGYKGNGLYGMATEADIVMVGTQNLTDVVIANAVNYTFQYANQENKPAVVNLSLGQNDGPHDGSTEINHYFDQLAKKGNIIVLSAGNEGSDMLYIGKTFSSASDELKTFPIDYNEGSRFLQGTVDTWSKSQSAVGVKLVVYSTTTQAIVYQSKVFKPSSPLGATFVVDSNSDSNFAKYYDGSVHFWSGVESNNRYHVWCRFEASIPNYETTQAQPKYRLGLVYTSDPNNSINIWSDDYRTYLSGEGEAGWTDGNSSCSINDFATTNSVISVGAYSTRNSYVNIGGKTINSNIAVNDIASFSSYGIDYNNIARPDVTAPGQLILSAVNSYDASTVVAEHSSLAAEITVGGRKHQWGQMAGTSMSSPTVAGIIALWLQADPNLDVYKIREILNLTSIKDSYVLGGNPIQWGAGKIDALAGLIRCITTGTDQIAIENSAVIIYPNPSDGHFKLVTQGESSKMKLNVYAADGAWIASRIVDVAQKEVDVDLSNELSSGLYFVQLIGQKTNHTSRLIIK